MRNERKKQVLTLSILAVSVLAISVGFAAFSSVLRINTTAQVTPDSSAFAVKFSTVSGTTATTGTVTPTVAPSAETTNAVAANPTSMGDSATIVNGTVPTISGLNAKFTSPGDTVSYTFYVRNEGAYTAYLNSINYNGYASCEAGLGTTFSLVQAACDDIKVTVTVGSVTASDDKTNITGETLTKDQSKTVTVTISYASNGARADGPFTVNFGDISLYYASVTGENEEIVSSVCTLADTDNDRIADTGEVVTCTKDSISESFYVVDNSGSNINMLSKYTITLSETSPLQDPTDTAMPSKNGIAFSSTNYWYIQKMQILKLDMKMVICMIVIPTCIHT